MVYNDAGEISVNAPPEILTCHKTFAVGVDVYEVLYSAVPFIQLTAFEGFEVIDGGTALVSAIAKSPKDVFPSA